MEQERQVYSNVPNSVSKKFKFNPAQGKRESTGFMDVSIKSHRPSTPKINLLKLPAMHKPKLSMQIGQNRIKTQAQGSAAINPFDYNT